MNRNFIYSDVNDALPNLMAALLLDGDEFGSRAGRTLELMHVGITLRAPWRRELVLPVRKASIAAQIVETMWVLSGRSDIEALTPYLPRAADFSDNGMDWRAGYGPRLRDFHGVDQLAYVVDTLRANPSSRQAVATIWDPTVDTTPGKDIACNNWLSFSSRLGYLDLHVGIRSNDAMWGWSGINAFEWSALQEIVARMLGLWVGSLHFSVTSFHLYERHWKKASRLSQEGVNFMLDDPPRFDATGMGDMRAFDVATADWWGYEGAIRRGQSVDVEKFPEPMLRSWLRVLQWYWSGDVAFLEPLKHTRLAQACLVGVEPAGTPQEPTAASAGCHLSHSGLGASWTGDCPACGWPNKPAPAPLSLAEPKPSFLDHVNKLHAEKHAAYGDSWKKRGESGILGNIARKIDRIDRRLDTSDETQADTAIDLLVYLAKYRCWLTGHTDANPKDVKRVLTQYEGTVHNPSTLVEDFAFLETLTAQDQKLRTVDAMLGRAYTLARSRWS